MGSPRKLQPVNVVDQPNTTTPRLAVTSIAVGVARRLWILFWLLVVLQAMDLATTYAALAKGAHEGNPALRGLLFTPVAPALKSLALVFFAILIVRSTNRGRPAPERLLAACRFVALIYLLIVANNVFLVMRGR